MISIIIPKYDDRTYFRRCINAIRQQTYKDLEVFIVCGTEETLEEKEMADLRMHKIATEEKGKYAGLRAAILAARGDYIFFCDIMSVLAPTTLEKLLENASSFPETFSCARCLIPDKKGYKHFERMGMSYYGKLFRRDILVENSIFPNGNKILAESIFNAKYLRYYSAVTYDESIYIYETSVDNLETYSYEGVDCQEWQELFGALANLKDSLACSMSEDLCLFIRKYQMESAELMVLAEKYLHHDYKLNYTIAKPVVLQLWTSIFCEHDFQQADILKNYFRQYESEEFLALLLSICGLDRKQYHCLQNSDIKDAIFFIEEFRKNTIEDVSVEEKLEPIRETVAGLEDIVRVIEDELAISLRSESVTIQKILKGIVPGLVPIGNTWYYYNKGEVDRGFSGLAKNTYGWWYVENGTIQKNFTGLAENVYGRWYVQNGKVNTKVNGYKKICDQGAYFKNGRVDVSVSGLKKTMQGWHYFTEGMENTKYKGLVKNTYGWWYVENGAINCVYKGLVQNAYGMWYVENGTVNYAYTGMAQNEKGWWYVEKGKVKEGGQEHSRDADQIVRECHEGKVGLKTIFRMCYAWFAFKVHRRGA